MFSNNHENEVLKWHLSKCDLINLTKFNIHSWFKKNNETGADGYFFNMIKCISTQKPAFFNDIY